MKTETKAAVFNRKLEELTLVRVVRSGLVSMIPVLTIGAFALILQTFPVAGYQRFLSTAVGGFFLDLFEFVYKATFGVLSVYMTFAISRAYMKQKSDGEAASGGAVMASLLTFFILAGAYLPEFGVDNMGPKSMFLAIITGLGASTLYFSLQRRLRPRMLFSTGSDREFNRMLSTLAPLPSLPWSLPCLMRWSCVCSG